MTEQEKQREEKAAQKKETKPAEKKQKGGEARHAHAEKKQKSGEAKPVHAEKKYEAVEKKAEERVPKTEAAKLAAEAHHAKKAPKKHVASVPVAGGDAPTTGAAVEKKPKKARKKSKVALARGKRKRAIARAVVSPGKGRFVFNKVLFDAIPNVYIREIVREPLNFLGAELAGVDINVRVRGGGQMGQAQAARTAIAKALVEYTQDGRLKGAYLEYDRSLLVEDVRRVEPKKYKGPKARARFQKSYR